MEFDTIAAISTPRGEGAIGIVRLSGDEAVAIVDKFFRKPNRQLLADCQSHTIHYGHLVDPATDQIIEEVMVSLMLAPRTYTKENVVEINCHGGIMTINKVLELALTYGARLSEPGEFTKRAFLNGRIDLSQAEGIMDFIRSKTERAQQIAMSQMEGRLSTLIQTLRQDILQVLAQVEVNIDYPEYDDVEEATTEFLLTVAHRVEKEIDKLLLTSQQGKIMRDGLATAIIGRPNVGKSSLLNNLLQENKAIVTDIAGTTRDILEEYVNVRGVPLRLIDTAGIRETEDIVEKIGVERSHKALQQADLVLFVLNNNESLTEADKQLFALTQNKDVIIIVNKQDLENHLDLAQVREMIGEHPLITTSMTQQQGIDELEQLIADLFFAGDIEQQDATYVSNSRHIALLKQAKTSMQEAVKTAEMGMPIDMVQIDLVKAWELLGEVIGEEVSDALLNQLFSQFCLGK